MPTPQNPAQERLRSALSRMAHLPADAGLPSSADQAQAEPREPYYRFATGPINWAFPAGVRAEALARPDWAPLPGAARTLLGLCNLRGELVPIYQLHSLVGAEAPSSPAVVIFGEESRRVGLVVDDLPTRLLIHTADVPSTVPEHWPRVLQSLVLKELQYEGQSLLALEVTQLGEALYEYAREEARHPTPTTVTRTPPMSTGATP